MKNLTRRDFILMCGAGLTGVIGTTLTINQLTDDRTEYITNLTVNPDEFLMFPNKDQFYIALKGTSLLQSQETDFVNELISKNIVPYDACDIHTLPQKDDGIQNIIVETSISTEDNLNYTITSKNKDIINNIQKHSSDILAKNNELFNQTKTR